MNNKLLLLFMSLVFATPMSGQFTSKVDLAKQLLRTDSTFLTNELYSIDEMRLSSETYSQKSGVTHIYLQQYIGDIPVHNAITDIHLTKENELLAFHTRAVKGAHKRRSEKEPTLTPKRAVQAALRALDLTMEGPLVQKESKVGPQKETIFDKGELALEDIKVKLIYQPMEKDQVRLAWQVDMYMADQQNWWLARMDAITGELLEKDNLVISCNFGHEDEGGCRQHDHDVTDVENKSVAFPTTPRAVTSSTSGSYHVLPMPVESPNYGVRSIVIDPADSIASPFGWHDTSGVSGAEFTITRGNNVWAGLDRDGIDGPDSNGSPDGGSNLEFDFPVDFNGSPLDYQPAAVTNLFYWSNLCHDVWYQYGFDEISGNFQANNYGNGGAGNDFVRAEAQDWSGTCNANMSTPPDGGSPRIQMYLCSQNGLNRDGDFDNGVIAHEYAHGISNRLVGGPNSLCLGGAEQMGEGWSDWVGLMMTIEPGDMGTDSRTVGTWMYVQGSNGSGIRTYPYTTDLAVNPDTYDAIKTASGTHRVGSIWNAMIWEVTWALIDRYGFDADFYKGTGGNNIAMHLIIEGMKLTPCSPGFVDARDAILAADVALYSGANQCLIWRAFAKRGLGFSASQGSSGSRVDGTEAFDLPLSCTIDVTPETLSICQPTDAVFNVDIGADLTTNVSLNGTGQPSGTTLTFSANPVTPDSSSQMIISNTDAAAIGTYQIVVTGVDNFATYRDTVELKIFNGIPSKPGLLVPGNLATNLNRPNLTWTAVSSAESYDLQLASDSAFTNTLVNAIGLTDTNYQTTGLAPLTTFYWRVSAVNACGSNTSAPFSFTTDTNFCHVLPSTNVPVTIPTSADTIISTLQITTCGKIVDLNVMNLDIAHSFIDDLIIDLTSPSGTTVRLMNRPCGFDKNILINFDDEAASPTYPCPPTDNGFYQPLSPLSAFDGEPAIGTWTLTVIDYFNLYGGTLNNWSLDFCTLCGIDVTPRAQIICKPASAVYEVEATSIVMSDVTLSASGQPAGTTVTFSVNPVAPSNLSQMTISNTGAAAAGIYQIEITGIDGDSTYRETVELELINSTFPPPNLVSPTHATANLFDPVLNWNVHPSAENYDLQIASDSAFADIIINATGLVDTQFQTSELAPLTTYYWRVSAVNACGNETSAPFSFMTRDFICGVLPSVDVPILIPFVADTITSTLEITTCGKILDLNVINLDIAHTYISELIVDLTSPSGTTVRLMDRPCSSEDDILISFDDGAVSPTFPCPPTDNETYQPFSPLSAFNGELVMGTWTLTVIDVEVNDGGTLNNWSLDICTSCGIDATPKTQVICKPTSAVYDVKVDSILMLNVTLTATGQPAGTTVSFNVNPVAPSNISQMTISNTGAALAGTYQIEITGTDGVLSYVDTVNLEVMDSAFPPPTLLSPANTLSNQNNPILIWNVHPSAESYNLQLASDSTFTDIIINATGLIDTNYQTNGLAPLTSFYWRVSALNACGNEISAPYSFSTGRILCDYSPSVDVPVNLPTGVDSIISTLEIESCGQLVDLDVMNLDIAHVYIDDLIIDLTSPSGTTVRLMNRPCGSEHNILINFDDEAANQTYPCPPIDNGIYQPFSPLSAFNGENIEGTWTLTVYDVYPSVDGGSLINWGLDICIDTYDAIVFVDDDAMGLNTGLSWTDAYTDIQSALADTARCITEIWVAAGTYKPTSGTDRWASFDMKNNLAIYGGFDGTEGSGFDLNMRDFDANTSLLSGEISGPDSTDNSYTIVVCVNGDSTAIIDGFTISDANGNDEYGFPSDPGRGGGVHINGGNPTIANCRVMNNTALFGGGIYILNSSPYISHCRFVDNRQTWGGYGGGGIMAEGTSSPFVQACTFEGNYGFHGGGLYFAGGSPLMDNCAFVNNHGIYGGAIANVGGTTSQITNCLIRDNTAAVNGGGIVNYASSSLINCTISGNQSNNLGGGIFNESSSYSIKNCIIWGNNTGIEGSGTPTVTYSIVQGGYTGVGNLDVDPRFVSSVDLRPLPCSPAIDMGDNAGNSLPMDISGNPRIFNATALGTAIIDMGAYEMSTDNTLPTNWSGLGDGILWTDALNWDDGFIPQTCRDIIISSGTVTVPAGFTAKGKTLEVMTGAQIETENSAVMEIESD